MASICCSPPESVPASWRWRRLRMSNRAKTCSRPPATAAPDVESSLEEVYALFGILRERQHQLAGTLSGGQQQMLAIGRGLMADPRILLLDEPSLGLAPLLVDAVFDVVVKLNKQGHTILLVEQNAYRSLEVSHYAYVLETGRMTLEGQASELIDHPHVKKAYLGR